MVAGMKLVGVGLMCVAAAGLSACDTAPKNQADKTALTAQGSGALTAFENSDSTLNTLIGKSVGYAIFPSVGKAGFGVGGAYGRGTVYERNMMIGWADISQGTVGLQVGAQSYDELIISSPRTSSTSSSPTSSPSARTCRPWRSSRAWRARRTRPRASSSS